MRVDSYTLPEFLLKHPQIEEVQLGRTIGEAFYFGAEPTRQHDLIKESWRIYRACKEQA